MTDKLIYTLNKNGYKEMISRGEKTGYRIFYDITASLINSVIFVDAIEYSDEFIKNFKDALSNGMGAKNLSTHFFIIILVNSIGNNYTEQLSVAKQVCDANAFSWIYDEATDELVVFDSQAEEFYGLRNLLSKAKLVTDEEINASITSVEVDSVPLTKKEIAKEIYKSIPKATFLIVLTNIIVYIICAFTGNLLYNKGAVGLKLLEKPIDWYRLITSIFLHVNEVHLFGNMLLLYCTGEIVEKRVKPLVFLLLYFVSGIWGSIATFISEIITGNNVVVIGASGAVFGVLGALLALVIFKKIDQDYMKIRRVVWAIFLAIYSGFASDGHVANWAHVGGLLAGFLVGLIYCLVSGNKKVQGITNED